MTIRKPSLLANIFSVPFIVCVLVLGAAAAGRGALERWLDIATRKEPAYLRKPLAALDKTKLGDYVVKHERTLSAAVEDALGTDQYLDWTIEDTSVPNLRDPRRWARLSVTYYTGGDYLVPHTPDVCMVGGGYRPSKPHEYRDIEVPALGEAGKAVPVRVCTFGKTAIHDNATPTVVYTFHTNGGFTASRTGVRQATARLTDRYAYFSKVEVSFGQKGCNPPDLGREESIEATAKLFDQLLPILLEEHWPDWEAVSKSKPAEQS